MNRSTRQMRHRSTAAKTITLFLACRMLSAMVASCTMTTTNCPATTLDARANWFSNYRDYDAVNAKLNDLVARRPDLVSPLVIGTTHEGRTINGVRITGSAGSKQDKPSVLLNGGQHAHEWISVMAPMYIADRMVAEYDSNPVVRTLTDQVEFIIIPTVNPDGYVYSWETARLWRGNRRDNGDGTFGVDLNRNWGFHWGEDRGNASAEPGSLTYRGPAPFSEPETRAMRDFYLANPQIISNMDFHSSSQLVLSPWAYTRDTLPSDHILLDDLASTMAASMTDVHGTEYRAGNAADMLYPISGASIDWTYGSQGVFSYVIELRPNGGLALPPEQIIANGEEIFPAVLDLARFTADFAVVPELSTFQLLGIGLFALAVSCFPRRASILGGVPVAGLERPRSVRSHRLFTAVSFGADHSRLIVDPYGSQCYNERRRVQTFYRLPIRGWDNHGVRRIRDHLAGRCEGGK